MQDFDSFDFLIFYEVLFPDDEDRTIECPHCNNIIEGSQMVEWVVKGRIFKCPECGEKIEVD